MPTDLAQAIAHAEGFGKTDAIPTLAHNPGDLVCAWLPGQKMGSEGIHVFDDDASGWAALEHQLNFIAMRKSHVYTPEMSIADMASHWTRTQQSEWAENVVDWLRAHGRLTTTLETPLSAVLG